MRYQVQRSLVYFSCFLRLSSMQLFKDSVVEPDVDIPFPEALFSYGRDVHDSPFEDCSGPANVDI